MSVQTPEEMVEESRQVLNARVRELQRELGIFEHSDVSIGTAIDLIRSLGSLPRRLEGTEREELIGVRWFPACLLTQYLGGSDEWIRDFDQPGVYVLIEVTPHGEVPLLVEATTRYVGESRMLSQRLGRHIRGTYSTPADRVMQEFLLTCSTQEQAAYATATRQDQRKLKQLAMERRGLWVKVTHCENKEAAQRLERIVIRDYESRGVHLWNNIKYSTVPPGLAPM